MEPTKIMGHSWSCPICGKLFRRESENYGDPERKYEARNRARTNLQWDAINHLANNHCLGETKNE